MPFEEGPQGKGHFRLSSSGRVVALYDYEDEQGSDVFNWTTAMGIDEEWISRGYGGQPNFYYQTIELPQDLPTIESDRGDGTLTPLQKNNNRNALWYTPDYATGCADYGEEGYEATYPKGKWRVPSLQELCEMHIYQLHIGDLAVSDGNYWSSTDQNVTGASKPGSYLVHIRPSDGQWYSAESTRENRSKEARLRCVYDDPDPYVLQQKYRDWYYNPNNKAPGDNN